MGSEMCIRDRLKQRFGNSKLIIASHFEQLRSLPNLHRYDLTSARDFSNKLGINLRALRSWNISDPNSFSFLCLEIETKLPAFLRNQMETRKEMEQLLGNDHDWIIFRLSEWLQRYLDRQELLCSLHRTESEKERPKKSFVNATLREADPVSIDS